MAYSAEPPGLMIVPQGNLPVPESFINFLLDNDLGAFLAKPTWTKEKESGATGFGIRIAPGSC